MDASQFALLKRILSQPTAPFREGLVVDVLAEVLRLGSVPSFRDPVGNLIVGAESPEAYRRKLSQKTADPLRLFIAHMDHPGFHGVRWLDDRRLAVRWYGGSPTRYLSGAKVWLATEGGYAGEGVMRRPQLAKHGFGLEKAEVHLPAVHRHLRSTAAKRLFGGFGFRAPVWRAGRRLYTKAADDLMGVFSIVQVALDLWESGHGRSAPFLGLLTRAEEVGFVGALGHLELGWLKRSTRPVVAVSLEASRTLPGAEIGSGPVVRLGDRRTVFDTSGLQALSELAQAVIPGRFQRRIMDGGACEGTATTAFGIPTIALSIPLGNYHNQGFEGGQDCRGPAGPAPEFVHLDDARDMLALCRALVTGPAQWRDPWKGVRQRLRTNYRKHRPLL